MRNEFGRSVGPADGFFAGLSAVGPGPLPAELVEGLCSKLLSKPARQAALYARNSSLFTRPEVVRHLVARSFAGRSKQQDGSLKVAWLALRLARRACREPGAPGPCCDALAEAAANLGNLFRLREQFQSAERLVAVAQTKLKEGTGNPRSRGWVLLCAAPLHLDRGRLEEAHRDSSEAHRVFSLLGEPSGAARAAMLCWAALFYSGRVLEGLAAAREVMGLTATSRDKKLGLLALHNLLLSLEALRYPALALQELERAEAFYREHASASLLIRASWLQGRLFCSVGRLGEAATQLERVRQQFLVRDLAYDASLTGLDLALVYAKQKQPHLVYKLASEMLPVFQAQQVPREASAVLLLFAKAAELWRADAATVEGFLAQLAPIRRSSGR